MLILYRKKGDSIMIGEDITISVVESGADGVRLAIDAPKSVKIMRKELVEAAKANREAAEAHISNHIDEKKETLKKMNALLKKQKH